MQNVKGTADYWGKEQALRQRVQQVLRNLFELYDYEAMETAMLSEQELLLSKYAGGDEIVKEMYRFIDQGGRRLGLRYDLTIPFAKVIALNPGIELPFRRYELGKVFRDGPVKRGRLREFMQCDADVVGIEGPEAEAELMQLAVEAFRQLELPVLLKWNNRRFLGELLESIGVQPGELLSVMLTLDKLDKIGLAGVREELGVKGLPEQTVTALAGLIERKSPTFGELAQAYGLLESSGAGEVAAMEELIGKLGLEAVCVFDPFLSRGLSFYTGTVYEIVDATGSYSSSLGGGGRYDAIIGQLAGHEEIRYPTVGLSFGMESIMAMLAERPFTLPAPAAMIIPIGGMTVEALSTAARLRAAGLRIRVELGKRKLRKTLASAAAHGIRYVILIGEEEARLGQLKLRDMQESTEAMLTLEKLEAVLLAASAPDRP
ncbi:histidine--tRNA ligase [Paenibacillus filicis]|uniref:Histidine--tRNA ligase n=1 Tax=Paenibacillus filicis TaxID=669464 RepID=A0ABU9DJQ2_9BACL